MTQTIIERLSDVTAADVATEIGKREETHRAVMIELRAIHRLKLAEEGPHMLEEGDDAKSEVSDPDTETDS